MTELSLEVLRAELQLALDPFRGELESIRGELAFIRARVTMTGGAIDVLQRDMRMLKAAINDMARTNITAGEVQALHEDLQRVLGKQEELEARIMVLEERK